MKDKIIVKVADVSFTLVTDESAEFVKSVARDLDEKISAMVGKSNKHSKFDAAVICAMEFCSEKIHAEKEIRRLEDRIALFELGDKVNKDEIIKLRARCEEMAAALNQTDAFDDEYDDEPVEIEAGDISEIEVVDIQPQMKMYDAEISGEEADVSDAASGDEPEDEPEETREESRQKLAEIERLLKSN
jgi:Cell division protein ZapA.